MMNAADTALLVVDLQEKLLPLIDSQQRLVWNTRRLMDAAALFEIPIAVTEQYPKGLGATTDRLKSNYDSAIEKIMFSCRECADLIESWRAQERSKIAVAGIESHVCVQQSVLDLLAAGFDVFVIADAIGARYAQDHEFALRRMENAGAIVTTCEAALFEWCVEAGTDAFRQISQLIRETPPDA